MQTDHKEGWDFFESQGDSTKVTSESSGKKPKNKPPPVLYLCYVLQQVYLKVGNCHNTRYTLQENVQPYRVYVVNSQSLSVTGQQR